VRVRDEIRSLLAQHSPDAIRVRLPGVYPGGRAPSRARQYMEGVILETCAEFEVPDCGAVGPATIGAVLACGRSTDAIRQRSRNRFGRVLGRPEYLDAAATAWAALPDD
jgi:hypothetical protein